MAKEWKFNGKTYRIIGRTQWLKEYGYQGLYEHRFNVLQVKTLNPLKILLNWSAWIDVEEEEVPMYAVISVGALGSTDWQSQLIKKCQETMGASA